MQKKPSNLHDHFFKEIYGKKECALELFELLFSKEEYALFDWKKLRIEKTEFRGRKEGEKRADLIYSAPIKGTDKLGSFFFILEHKSYIDKNIFLQLLHYQYYLYANNTPSIPIVIYHGRETEWKLGKDFQSYSLRHYPGTVSELLGKYMLNFPYKVLNIHKLHREEEESLTTSSILFILRNIWSLNREKLVEFFQRTVKLKHREKNSFLDAAEFYISSNDKRFNVKALEAIERKTLRKGERKL